MDPYQSVHTHSLIKIDVPLFQLLQYRDENFVSTLDEKSKAKAKAELGELNDKDRALAVQTLRRWVLDQKDWMPSRTDFDFLLRFLRVRKFSQLEARRTIENYWTCKTKLPSVYRDLDPADEAIQYVLKAGFIYTHKKVDSDGRRYLFSNPGAVPLDKVKEIGSHAIYRAMVLLYEWMMFDENAQVNGIIFMIDYTNMGLQLYMKFASIEEQSILMKFLQKSIPIRIKKMFWYNEPTFADVVFNFFKVFMTQKLQDRMIFLGDKLTKLYDVVDKSVIPDEYLPDDCTGAGPRDKIIEEMIEDMMQPKFRDYIRDVSSSKYEVDIEKRGHMENEPANSFRKLNVD